MSAPRRNFVADMTWKDVAERLSDGAYAILPIGAGAKEHGWHMPMATDQVQAEYFAERLTENINGIIWPTVTYGHYPAFVAYAGSVSISNDTFEALVGEIAKGIAEFGAREIIILNTGLSTIAPVERALSRLSARARHLKIYSGPRYCRAVKTLGRQSHGSHADENETSIMLAIAPDRVDMTRAADSPPLCGGTSIGPLNPSDASSENFSASGSFGQPSLASLENGRVFVQAILEDMLDGLSATQA
ncbi:MAG TPA: creatininase family protein [Lacipirellulaceae bacterium]|nr:creatininase family protein [Lacipirellulaceae bacterium]